MSFADAPKWVTTQLKKGLVIPAHPLALTAAGRFDQRHQRALTRYYAASGAGGVAVGVHTTQFEIRRKGIDLLAPVLSCAAGALDEIERAGGPRLVRIAGVCGPTRQAVAEALLAQALGYHAALLSLAALKQADDNELIRHCRAVAGVMPLMGFYLQHAVGGRRLSCEFWKRFAEIPDVVAVKVAPFNRYETLDVVRGLAASGRGNEIALYTGNDDNIVADLLTNYEMTLRFVGGLLGHWAVWTGKAVELLGQVRRASRRAAQAKDVHRLLALGTQVTDCNAALFDVANGFAGCIAGIQHVLYRQGLLASPRCLNPRAVLSPGQAREIARVRRQYPHLVDDDFVAGRLTEWLD